MAFDDDKSTFQDQPGVPADEKLTATEYNNLITDLKGHASRHEAGNIDEISVEGLAGDLADPQDPKQEVVEDFVDALLAGGDKITTTYDDQNDTLTIDTSALDAEEVRDEVGDLLVAGDAIDITVDDPGDSITVSIPASAIGTEELDESITPTWTGEHAHPGGITDLPTPTDASDAATKSYADAVEQGLDIKDSVRVAAESSIDLTSASDPNPVDGVTLADGDRVLLKDQTDAIENGIYEATTATDPTTWTRTPDADADDEVSAGLFTFVEEGTANQNRGFVVISDDPIQVGTTAIDFVQFSGAGQITAGDGLAKSGDTLSAVPEFIEDTVDALLTGGANISLTYDDTNDVLTVDTSALNEEEVEDAVAALVTGGNAITVNYDDPNDTLSVAVDESGLSFYDGANLTAPVDNDSVSTGRLKNSIHIIDGNNNKIQFFSTLTDALDAVSGGDVLVVPSGQYDPITIDTNDITLVGSGESTRFDGSNGVGITINANRTRLSRVACRASGTGDQHGIVVNGVFNLCSKLYLRPTGDTGNHIRVQSDSNVLSTLIRVQTAGADSVVFESGTSENIIDSYANAGTITDNGSNVIGETS